jgi:hypothetical protein
VMDYADVALDDEHALAVEPECIEERHWRSPVVGGSVRR